MKKVDIVFITLVYKNYKDLVDFENSIKMNVKCKYTIIVVDSFFDSFTSEKIINYVKKINCEYIQVPNHGYGFGNNCGIEFALENYEFKYLAICNPDTILKSNIDLSLLEKYNCCIAPRIITRKKKQQNPYWAYENILSEKIIYKGYCKNNKTLILFGILINKILRYLFYILYFLSKEKYNKIYSCHGSFIILNISFILHTNFRYDEKMFLFYEEAFHGFFVKKHQSMINYVNDILVYHKEDGSMQLSNISEYEHLKASFIYYFERYRKNG